MENSYETLNNDKLASTGQIMRHPSYYQPCGKMLLPWFDIRVVYVRISNFLADDSSPECLTLNYIALNPDTLLEVNGARCELYSEGLSCLLRRDRADKKSEEVTYVSTDNTRVTGSVKFEVLDKEDLVLSGALEISNTNGFIRESKNNARRWSMNCESVMCAGIGFFMGKQVVNSKSFATIR